MHAVGDGDWIEGEHAEAFHEDAASCQACHGHRLQGTARSRVARRQVFRLPGEGRAPVAFERGEAVSCGACHDAPALPCEAGG